MKGFDFIRKRYAQLEGRSQTAMLNIVLSFVTKGISIIISLLLIPLTIEYVNPTQYGIWLTLSSVIGWFTFFNLGLGNGFRNKFAEAIAKEDKELARCYTSTTYFAVSIVMLVLFSVAFIVDSFVDWAEFLNLDAVYSQSLHKVFIIVCVFSFITFVVNLFGNLLDAYQKNGLHSIIGTAGQLFSLVSIYILTLTTQGSLENLALYYAGVPCIVMLVASIYFFSFTKLRAFRPSFSTIKPQLIKNILSIGFLFFVINVCLLFIFQLINIIMTREIGALSVSQYNIAYRYFNVLYMAMSIIVAPFWSAFTDAYFKDDFIWMKKMLRKLNFCLTISIVIGLLMLIAFPVILPLWIGNQLYIPNSFAFIVFFYVCMQMVSTVYMYLINGIGTIKLQTIIYSVFALVAWPLLTFSCRLYGIYGILLFPSFVYLIQGILAKVQLNKLLNKTAKGIWIQ